ncbi:MAG: hypothetical protein CMH34_02905 [Microbacterium sp.]|nr:hypothetical protein [Microbacterium sp.]
MLACPVTQVRGARAREPITGGVLGPQHPQFREGLGHLGVRRRAQRHDLLAQVARPLGPLEHDLGAAGRHRRTQAGEHEVGPVHRDGCLQVDAAEGALPGREAVQAGGRVAACLGGASPGGGAGGLQLVAEDPDLHRSRRRHARRRRGGVSFPRGRECRGDPQRGRLAAEAVRDQLHRHTLGRFAGHRPSRGPAPGVIGSEPRAQANRLRTGRPGVVAECTEAPCGVAGDAGGFERIVRKERACQVEFRLGTRLRHPVRPEDRGRLAEEFFGLGGQPRIPEHLGAVHRTDRLGDGRIRGLGPRRVHVAQGADEVSLQQRRVAEIVAGLRGIGGQPVLGEHRHGRIEVFGGRGQPSLLHAHEAAVHPDA